MEAAVHAVWVQEQQWPQHSKGTRRSCAALEAISQQYFSQCITFPWSACTFHTQIALDKPPKFSKHIWGGISNQPFLCHHIIWSGSAFPFSSAYISISFSACWAYSHFLLVADLAFCRGHKTLLSFSVLSAQYPALIVFYFTVREGEKKHTKKQLESTDFAFCVWEAVACKHIPSMHWSDTKPAASECIFVGATTVY